MDTDTKKTAILDTLRRFIAQRPGLEFGNYGDVKTYRAEMRGITRDRHDAEELLWVVERTDEITGDDLERAFSGAYGGRLSCKVTMGGYSDPKDPTYRDTLVELSYTAGQYFPTEYRKAACAVLASALWGYVREHCMPSPCRDDPVIPYRVNGVLMTAGDWLRAHFRREFGRHIAARWFS